MNYYFFSSVPNFEEDVAKLQDEAGWISMNDYKKYAIENTELCKVEFVDRVFQKKTKVKEDQKKMKADQKKMKASKVKVCFKKFKKKKLVQGYKE